MKGKSPQELRAIDAQLLSVELGGLPAAVFQVDQRQQA